MTISMRTFIKSFAVVAISLLVLSLEATVAMAAGGSQAQGNSDQTGTMGKHGGDSSGIVNQNGGMMDQAQEQERMHQMMGESAKHGLFGGFNQTGSLFEGRFVSFTLNESTGSLQNYTVSTTGGDVIVFGAVSLGSFVPENVTLKGSMYVEEDSNASIVIHDNPVALLHMTSNGSLESISFTIGQGISRSAA